MNIYRIPAFGGGLTHRLFQTIICSFVLIAVVFGGLLLLPAPATRADGPDEAHVVVQFGSNDRLVRPISFTAPISGLKALELTGLEIVTKDFGGGFIAVCSIEGVGCPAADCLTCDPAGRSWANTFWNGAIWQGYLTGAADTTVNAGAIEGWTYGQFGPPPDFAPPMPLLPAAPLTAAAKALHWLAGQQSAADGGYVTAGNSVEVLMAIGANHYQGPTWRRAAGAPTLSDHVRNTGAAYAASGSAATGKLALGLSAGGGCYPHGAALPTTFYITATGIYSSGFGAGGAGPQAWGMLGTKALSQTVSDQARTYLKSIINADGGWGWSLGASDTNGTALALQALIAAGELTSTTEVISGVNYLEAAQNDDGGFPYDPNAVTGTDSDTNSTAYVVQALMAAGQNPLTGTWIISATNPISYLLSMQLSDGSLAWMSSNPQPNQFATRQAVPALLGRSFPLRMTDQIAACPAYFLPAIAKSK